MGYDPSGAPPLGPANSPLETFLYSPTLDPPARFFSRDALAAGIDFPLAMTTFFFGFVFFFSLISSPWVHRFIHDANQLGFTDWGIIPVFHTDTDLPIEGEHLPLRVYMTVNHPSIGG